MSNSKIPFANLNELYYPNLYTPNLDFSNHDKFVTDEGVVDVDYTFKRAMKVIAYQQDGNIEGIMEELRLSYTDSLFFLKGMSEQRWVSAEENNDTRLGLTEEEKAKIYQKEKKFDYLIDFDAYYPDFIEFFHIDLLEQDISFTKFNWLLGSLFLKETSTIAKRLKFRNYTKDKNESHEYAKVMTNLKKTYAFYEEENADLYEIAKRGGH